MEGEEDEALKVSLNEPGFDVGGGEPAVAGPEAEARVAEFQCEPEPRAEPGEMEGTVGGDVVGGEEREAGEEAKEEDFEMNGVENEVAVEKDSENEVREEEKVADESETADDILAGDVAATEMVSAKGGFDDVAAEAEERDSPPESGGSADVAAEEDVRTPENRGSGDAVAEATEMAPEENGLADVAAEETEAVPGEGGVADVATEEAEIALEDRLSGDPVAEGTEMVPEEGGLADVASEMTEVVSEKRGSGDVAAAAEETEIIPEERGLGDAVAVEGTEIVPEANVVAEETEIVPEEGGLGDAATEETETVPVEGVLAGVAPEESEIVPEKGSGTDLVMEETETASDTGVASEEGGLADVTESTAEVIGGVQLAAEEGKETETVPEIREAAAAATEGEEVDMANNDDGGGGEEFKGEAAAEEEADPMDEEAEEETVKAETEVGDAMEEDGPGPADEAEVAEEVSRGKRRRGKNVKAPARAPSWKKMEEDVCFICFDGGELVLCDRRGCPKAYHPTCVNRDDAFFRSKGRWNCGWHLCSNCGKNAYYMCFTCTYSLCKACAKDGTILCVRGNKGFCETCMKTVKLIEKNEGNMNDNVNFDDKSSWEYLFKDYYTDLKEKLSLTPSELAEAKSPWKVSDSHSYKQESADEPFDPNNDVSSHSDGSSGNLGSSNNKRRKPRKRAKARPKDKDSRRKVAATNFEGMSVDGGSDWASKELLEFVMHMRDGDASALSQFDVQALLLEYIKRNKLRDPRRKSQIICDPRLQNIFGKPRVGHFEMLKLLESHFLIKEDSHVDELQGSVVDTETSHLEADGNSDTPGKAIKDKKRKSRRKGDVKGPQSNLDDYAAIDTHNINLIYLRRNLVEDLIDDVENFHNQAVGAFVRIRIAGNNQKQDLYRLVQVVGTSKAAEPYKVGKKITDTCLEILNLDKTETLTMDIISNQEFTEEECKRLRQSIRCGLINRLTVGDVQEKAIALQAVRVKDWLESEIVRLSHLRDRASETGRKKDLRECVEKLQVLKSPEERQRRLEEIPEIHTDPNMDPNFESEEEEADDKRRENFMKARGSSFGRRGREPISPRKGISSYAWSGTRSCSSTSPELSRNMSGRGFSAKVEENPGVGDVVNDLRNHGRDRELQRSNNWDKHKMSSLETGSRTAQSVIPSSESFHAVASENQAISTGVSDPAVKINESEKVWHYKDPSGKVQGPFSIVQLRKWNATGYFPADLRIWKQTEKQDDLLLLTDVLAGKIQKDKVQLAQNLHSSPLQSTNHQVGVEGWRSQNAGGSLMSKVAAPTPVEVPKHSSDTWGSTNLPSPTPSQTPLSVSKVQLHESKWSGNPVQSSGSLSGVDQFQGNSRATQEGMLRVTENNSTPSKPEQISAPVLNHASGANIQSVVSNLQSLVQSVASHLPPSETEGWVKPDMIVSTPTAGSESQPWRAAASQKVEPSNNPVMMQGHWNDASTMHNPAPAGNFPATGFQAAVPSSDPWRPPVSGNQQNPQPQNSSWGPLPSNQNMPWVPPPPPVQNPSMNWGVLSQGMAPGNTNSGWGPAPNQGPAHGNPGSGWGPQPNANQGWGSGHGHGQGQGPGNANTGGWVGPAPSGNQGGWGSERGHGSDRFGNQDSGYGGGGKPWNRASSFGGGSSRPPFRGQRVCKYHESGHCKKGASCDYLHT